MSPVKIAIAKMVLWAIFKMAANENGIYLIFNYHRGKFGV